MAGRAFERLSYDRAYDQALAYLYNLQKFGIKFGLSKTENLLKAFDHPHRRLTCLHIAGSNGKGSVAAMLASIYRQAGYKVGLFTSPHLVDFRERFQINGQLISKTRTLALIKEIQEKTDREEPPTFFEFVTAMALLWFDREKVDLAIMETGLGGRLDATNIIKPLVSIITNISLEHQDYLGKTLDKIAWEKAGIIKKGVPLITGAGQRKVQEQFENICRERKAPMFLAGRDFRTRKRGEREFSYFGFRISASGIERKFGVYSSEFRVKKKGRQIPQSAIRNPQLKGLKLALYGDYQIKNAGLVLAAVEVLQKNYPVAEAEIRRGLLTVAWPGRLEVLSERPFIILDGAHNPGAMNILVKSLPRAFSYRKLLLVFGMMKDKNIRQTLKQIAPISDRIFLTRAEYDRSADPKDLLRFLESPQPRPLLFPSIPLALSRAIREAGPEDLILITGSLFIVGEARAWWESTSKGFSH
ncbi:MAG: folylpolyglutamate synthase/dihydrofolate synthase family protein [Thermodesulfobacteriota bacterium]